ncbi:MAG: BolA family transcriptional regulator [Nitrospira sp.]|nr:BolA family transcriptional regulator [Nitrospira sp.]
MVKTSYHKAARSTATEAYPLGYVAGRHATENAVRWRFHHPAVHLKVSVVSAAFAGKNLLDRHRMIYQALDVPMKDGRIHALELTAKTQDET